VVDALHFTGDEEADRLLAAEPLALLIGFGLDQQVTVPAAFSGPLKLRQRLGRLDAAEIAGLDPERLEAVFRERPVVHRFPASMARRVQELCAVVAEEYGGDASRIWNEASDTDDLRRRIESLPGFGEMKVKGLASVLSRRLGVAMAEPLVPTHDDRPIPTLGDVDSPEALAAYQAAKRAYKAELRAAKA
jgi:uncharacterized HhH-GPD family protein